MSEYTHFLKHDTSMKQVTIANETDISATCESRRYKEMRTFNTELPANAELLLTQVNLFDKLNL